MKRRSATDWDALVNRIYDAAIDASLWSSVLDAAAAHFGASKSTVYTPDLAPEQGGFFFSHNIPPESFESYASRYRHMDPWISGHHQKFGDACGGFLGSMLIPTGELEKTEFYADHLRQHDILQLCAAVTKGGQSNADIISFAMYRGRRAQEFGEEEVRLSERIVPHLQRAFLISSRLRSAADGVSKAMLAVVQAPIILVDAMARISQASPSAVKILQEGVWLQAKWDRLAAVVDNDKFRKSVFDIASSGAVGPFSRLIGLVHPRLGCTYHVLIARGGKQFPGKAFVVLGAAASDRGNLGKRLLEVYALTPAEVRLCEHLLNGRSIGEAAELLFVKRSTVQSQLKSVFRKMGLSRQSEVMMALVDIASL
ncbi:helix-turn-helix transcriptional regulator [Reyranella sp.]|uniref:helix-turn-helix transcriptional regulator n=1 Tax=Reyranella sp. TaxID=1929291 RepID=UPI003F701AB6